MNIFCGSLPFRLQESELKEFFEEYGEVSAARIITDKFSGRSKGFGFIEMPDDEQAKKAIEELDGAEVDGRTIVVNQAEERKDTRGGGNQRGGGGGYGRGGDSRGQGRRSDY
ncbi:MAG TPA: RNA-binding protein [Bacteroidales bacterium]|jgi:RNA recognition motif-containing protein|nr:RNA-binding protein [Bacteroidales bacterium]